MSYLYRWVRQNQTLACRSAALLAGKQGNITSNTLIANQTIKPIYQMSTTCLSTSAPYMKQENDLGKTQKQKGETKDDIKYEIKFKEIDYRKMFKEFYSLYGPLFIVCHIGVSLCSLGFWCSLAWFAIDLGALVPEFLVSVIGQNMTEITGASGKFVVAYAIHKFTLPIRLGLAIGVTRAISRFIKARKAIKSN